MSGTSLEGEFKIILKARCFPGVWDKSLTVSARWGKSTSLQRGLKEGERHFEEAALLLLLVVLIFMFLFAVFLRRSLSGSMPFGQHVTIISEQPSQLSLTMR